MLSDRYFRLIGFQLKVAYWLNGTPFRFCAKERRLYVTPFSYFKYAYHLFLLVLYALFLVVQLIRYNRMGLNKDFSYYYLYALAVCAVFDLVSGYPFLRRPQLAAAFMTEFWRFLEEIQVDFMPNFNRNRALSNMIFDGAMFLLVVTAPFFGLVISFHYVFFPYWSCYLNSLVPQQYLTWHVVVLNGIGYFYGLQVIWAVLLTQGICFSTYGWYNWHLSEEYYCFPDEVKGPPGDRARKVWRHQKASSMFRSIEEFPRRYRQFQVMHLNFQEVFSSMVIPIQVTVLNLGVFCNCSLIKYNQILTFANVFILLIWSVGGTCCLLTALTFAGNMQAKSVRALGTVKNKNWGSKKNNLLMRMFARSCMPISYGYGRMYTIRKLTTFKFIKHLTRGTFRALLTLLKNKK